MTTSTTTTRSGDQATIDVELPTTTQIAENVHHHDHSYVRRSPTAPDEYEFDHHVDPDDQPDRANDHDYEHNPWPSDDDYARRRQRRPQVLRRRPVGRPAHPRPQRRLPDTITFRSWRARCACERCRPSGSPFQNLFPSLAGRVGTLTFTSAATGEFISSQSALVYEPGATVDILYPGTRVNSDGSIADVPGWNLNSDGFWVQDPSDAFLREGVFITYHVNPTAGPGAGDVSA